MEFAGEPLEGSVELRRGHKFPDHRMIPCGIKLVLIPFEGLELAEFRRLEKASVKEIFFVVGLRLGEENKIAEKFLLLLVESKPGDEFRKRLLGQVPLAVHHQLEKVGRFKPGPF